METFSALLARRKTGAHEKKTQRKHPRQNIYLNLFSPDHGLLTLPPAHSPHHPPSITPPFIFKNATFIPKHLAQILSSVHHIVESPSPSTHQSLHRNGPLSTNAHYKLQTSMPGAVEGHITFTTQSFTPHITTPPPPREVVVIFLGGNDLANLATDQHLKNALLNPAPPLNKLLIQITIFNITSRLIDIYNYFKAFCKHVKICKLIRRPSMSDFLKPLVIAINSQLTNRLPNNTLIDTYNSITTHYICTDRTHLKKSGQDLLYRRIKHAILNP